MPRGLIRKNRTPDDEYYDVSTTVKLSESMLARLQERKAQTGVPIATQLRRAIERDLAATATPEPEPLPDNVIAVELPPELHKRVAAFSESVGIKSLSDFVAFVLRRAVSVDRRETMTFLYGDFYKSGEAARAAEQERQDAIRAEREKQAKPRSNRKENAA